MDCCEAPGGAVGDPMDIAVDLGTPTGAMMPLREPRIVREEPDDPILDDNFSSIMASSMVPGLLNATSNPVSPGSSSPTPDPIKSGDFVPPTRPSSTPFPHPDHRPAKPCCLGEQDYDDNEWTSSPESPTLPDAQPERPVEELTGFTLLPIEVHEAILDHLFGYRVSATSRSGMRVSSVTKKWGTALRHSRRRELTELSMVSDLWRILVQQRLYRHIKLKATMDFLDDAMLHFGRNLHLQPYVKHIEIWFPVFQPTYGPLALSNTLTLPTVTIEGLTNATYTLPGNNCTLEEVFYFVAQTLPQARVMTLEGGERRKAPRVVHFHEQRHNATADTTPRCFPVIESVQTLVTRGQWNLMRNDDDFKTVLSALPNLVEWQGSYSKPKSKSYLTMAGFLPHIPSNITNLNLCLESDYRREGVIPAFYSKVVHQMHICSKMAEALLGLEHFAYTGRVCHHFFDAAMRSTDPRTTKLRSIDLTVKNCCRPLISLITNFGDSGSGIQDMAFIDQFEKLVLSAIRSLEKFEDLEYLRIRFVDLDSVLPPLNPYFMLRNGKCSGVWSEKILLELARVRPEASYNELSESFGNIVYNKDGRMVITPDYPRTKITSLKLSNYRSLASGINIQ